MNEDTVAVAARIEVFKALSDPIRWSMITQIAEAEELACQTLETTLPVSKPTISYHAKILSHAGLINVRKEGRNYFYSLRRDILREVLDTLWELAPTPRPVVGQEKGRVSHGRSGRRQAAQRQHTGKTAEAVVLTW